MSVPPPAWAPPGPPQVPVSTRRGASPQQHQLMNPKIHRLAEPYAASFCLGQRWEIMLTLFHYLFY